MNKKYISRQLVLRDLNIPMDRDLEEYYNFFNDLLGDIKNSKLVKESSCVSYYRNDTRFLECDEDFGCFCISDYIWEGFRNNFNFDNEKTTFLLHIFLNHIFNKNYMSVFPSKFYDH